MRFCWVQAKLHIKRRHMHQTMGVHHMHMHRRGSCVAAASAEHSADSCECWAAQVKVAQPRQVRQGVGCRE